jgi:hypothetical protein
MDGEARQVGSGPALQRTVRLPALMPAAAALVAVLLWTGHTMVTATTAQAVYGVAAARAHLAQDPAHWLGRTILLRGQIVPCLAMPSAENGACTALAPVPAEARRGDHAASTTLDPLPLAATGLNPFLASLEHLPLLAGLLPAPHLPPWGTIGIYSIQLRAAPTGSCASPPCYEALLLDATPDAGGG